MLEKEVMNHFFELENHIIAASFTFVINPLFVEWRPHNAKMSLFIYQTMSDVSPIHKDLPRERTCGHMAIVVSE